MLLHPTARKQYVRVSSSVPLAPLDSVVASQTMAEMASQPRLGDELLPSFVASWSYLSTLATKRSEIVESSGVVQHYGSTLSDASVVRSPADKELPLIIVQLNVHPAPEPLLSSVEVIVLSRSILLASDPLPRSPEPPVPGAYRRRLQTLLCSQTPRLTTSHSNITSIHIGFGYGKSGQWDERPSLVVGVNRKGFIPWGEQPISHQDVSVVEGRYLHRIAGERLAVIRPGAELSRTDGELRPAWGSVGLVFPSTRAFITCAHVVERVCAEQGAQLGECRVSLDQPDADEWRRSRPLKWWLERTLLSRIQGIGAGVATRLYYGSAKVSGLDIGVDAAYCEASGRRSWSGDPRIPRRQGRDANDCYILDTTPVLIKDVAIDDLVVKRGARTGVTFGRVTGITHVNSPDQSRTADVVRMPTLKTCGLHTHTHPCWFLNQYHIRSDDMGRAFTDGGDSGSVVFRVSNDDRVIQGWQPVLATKANVASYQVVSSLEGSSRLKGANAV